MKVGLGLLALKWKPIEKMEGDKLKGVFSDGSLREANNGDLTVKERTRVKVVYVVLRLPFCPLIF